MDKYKVTSKGKKTLFCTYYNAIDTLTNTPVNIQKLSRREDWKQVLQKKDLLLMKQNKFQYFPSILQAVQEEGKFFIVMGQELGTNGDDLRKRKLAMDEIVQLTIKLLQAVLEVTSEGIELFDVRPELIFWDKSQIKIAYIPTLEETFLKGINGELADIKHQAPETVLEKQLDICSTVFSVGSFVAEMILGEFVLPAKNKLDYVYCLAQLFPKENENATTASLQFRLTKKCPKALIQIILDMMNPERQKRLGIQKAILRLQTMERSPSASEKSKTESENISPQESKIVESNLSKISSQQPEPPSPLPNLTPKHLITFNFHTPPEHPPLSQLVQQLQVVTLLKKQANINDDVAIATIITNQSHRSQHFQHKPKKNNFDFDIPQETVTPQLTVFARQESEEVLRVEDMEDQDNGLFEMI